MPGTNKRDQLIQDMNHLKSTIHSAVDFYQQLAKASGKNYDTQISVLKFLEQTVAENLGNVSSFAAIPKE